MTNDDDDPLTFYSDIIKGKISSPDHRMIELSWKGADQLPMSDFPQLSETFEEIAVEYPTIIKSLSQCPLFSTAALIGGLLTLPELQANCTGTKQVSTEILPLSTP